MATTPADIPIAVWAPPTSPLRVEYAAEVMEEIRLRATEGFYKLTRGGVEVAGLLLGRVQTDTGSLDTVRILAQLPFEIEYAHGPVFSLSALDHVYLEKWMEDLADPSFLEGTEASGLALVGLYVSHSRSPISLSETEIALFERWLPQTWQTILTLKPTRSSETEATFHVRELDGAIRQDQSHERFVLSPTMADRRQRLPGKTMSSLQALAEASRHPRYADPAALEATALEAIGEESANARPKPLRRAAAASAVPSAAPPPSSASTVVPPPAIEHRNVEVPPKAKAGPAAQEPPASPAPPRSAAGRLLWTGQLEPNQTLEITGRDASHGILTATLPGHPVSIRVQPGELSQEGLIVYSSEIRYRNARRAVEVPSAANEFNPALYCYDPDGAGALEVTAAPSESNGWQNFAVKNNGKDICLLAIDWQTLES
ncbi:MAG: hypothetical protein U5J83_09465 [Bryobacterales bacterium]|nr:hypothetical protein [Bryobacterales bacterium]